jgi:hypothetical protein
MFSYTIKKTSLLECGDCHAPLPSLHHHLQIVNLSEAPSWVQTDENQKLQGLDCVVCGQISVP